MKSAYVIFLLVLIVLVSGCINPNNNSSNNSSTPQNTGPYTVGNSTFYMPDGWSQINSNVTGAVEFTKNNDTHIRIQELSQNQYNTNYNNATKQRTNYNITVETKNMSNIEVKVVRTTDTTNGNIYDYYFIQKDGKYYQISAWDYKNKASARIDIDNAVTTIISTLKSSGNNSSGNTSNTNSNNNQNNTNNNNNNSNNNNNNNNQNNNGGDETCPTCGGAGVVPVDPGNPHTSWTTCPTCGGDGLV